MRSRLARIPAEVLQRLALGGAALAALLVVGLVVVARGLNRGQPLLAPIGSGAAAADDGEGEDAPPMDPAAPADDPAAPADDPAATGDDPQP